MHAPVRTSFVTTDPDVGSARVAEAYADNRMRVRGERESFHLEQVRVDIGTLRFDTFGNTLTTDYAMEPLRQVVIARMLDHEMDIWTERSHRRIGPDDVALVAQPDHEYSTRVHGARMQLVCVDLSLLDDVDGGTSGRSRRLRSEPLSPEQAQSWQRTVDYVTGILLDDDASANGLVLGNAARMLSAALLHAFGVPGEGTRELSPRMPAVVRRAVAYCEANPDLDLGVADIASACHVSVRTLQVAFRRHLGTTPMAYLRRVRLDRVRADLVEGDPGEVTVCGIAARWGFADASRFSAHYRAAYGESPGTTLRRG